MRGNELSRQSKQRRLWLFKITVHYIILWIFKISYGTYLTIAYRSKLIKAPGFKLKGPCLLLANHCNTFDGFFIQGLVNRPIHFVVTDGMFKNKNLRRILSIVNFIPKKKFVSDTKAIRQIIRISQNGGIIGIFPEGRRCWDGKTVKISPATFKLVRMLKIPVVTANMKGAYLSEPRWSNTQRFGKIEIEIKTLIDTEALAAMSLEQIEQKITKELYHSEYDWQDKHMIPFKGKALAEGFELLLYTCPQCGAMDSMQTSGSEISCKVCDALYEIDVYGYVHSIKGFLPSSRVVDINEWQLGKLRDIYGTLQNDQDVYMSNEGALLTSAIDVAHPFEEVSRGSISIAKNGLIIGGKKFGIADVYGVAVNMKSHVSFRHKSMDYRVSFENNQFSVYKWCRIIKIFIGNMEEAF